MYIDEIINNTIDNHVFYLGDEIRDLGSMVKFNLLLSEKMKSLYHEMPIINYELINKNIISSQAKKARRYVLEKIFDSDYEMNNLRETSAEKTMYRSLVEHTGISDITKIEIEQEGYSYNKNLNVLREIHKYFSNLDNETKIINLFKILQDKPFGLRKGVVILFLAKYLSEYQKNVIVVMEGRELSLTLNYLELIDDQPENFVVYISNDDKELVEYIKGLNSIFENGKVYNNLNIYEETYRKIEGYFKQLPSCVRNISYIFNDSGYSPIDKAMAQIKREFLKYDVNASSLLAEVIPNRIFKGKSFDEQLDIFRKMRIEYDNYLVNLKKYLINLITVEFGVNQEGLERGLNKYIEGFNVESLKYIDNVRFLKFNNYVLDEIKNDDYSIIEDIAHILSGVAIEDWNDKSIGIFNDSLNEIIRLYSSGNEIDESVDNKDYLVLKTKDTTIEKYLTRQEPSEEVKQVLNEVEFAIEEFMLDSKDKQTLLVSLLEKLFSGEL